MQSEAAVRHLAMSFPYDNLEDDHAPITLREGGDKINSILSRNLQTDFQKQELSFRKQEFHTLLMLQKLQELCFRDSRQQQL
jgi:hypothetical protein